ncbi:unnamed protein product [Staurois parvus]|uniref:Uncharacterized protein n=1 Tax=Staurois parvus TaxID=386267 RepID=A0ABN9FIP0_9NEOB|nr:unnamed protein product [Staurois parvus]
MSSHWNQCSPSATGGIAFLFFWDANAEHVISPDMAPELIIVYR